MDNRLLNFAFVHLLNPSFQSIWRAIEPTYESRRLSHILSWPSQLHARNLSFFSSPNSNHPLWPNNRSLASHGQGPTRSRTSSSLSKTSTKTKQREIVTLTSNIELPTNRMALPCLTRMNWCRPRARQSQIPRRVTKSLSRTLGRIDRKSTRLN